MRTTVKSLPLPHVMRRQNKRGSMDAHFKVVRLLIFLFFDEEMLRGNHNRGV